MKNNQRKNKKSLVLVAMILMIGLVAGMGAMTYSRYATSGTTTQTATAAKWGFVVNVDADELFGTDYKLQSGSLATYIADNGGVAVNADNVVVAPGTAGSMTFSIEGKAEVLAQITLNLTVASEINYNAAYYPVKWTLTKTVDSTTTTLVTAGKLSDVVTAINTGATTIEPGNQATSAGTYELSWEWALVTNDNTALNGTNRNIEDTLIGFVANQGDLSTNAFTAEQAAKISAAVGTTVTADFLNTKVQPTLEFTLTISIEQIQA